MLLSTINPNVSDVELSEHGLQEQPGAEVSVPIICFSGRAFIIPLNCLVRYMLRVVARFVKLKLVLPQSFLIFSKEESFHRSCK